MFSVQLGALSHAHIFPVYLWEWFGVSARVSLKRSQLLARAPAAVKRCSQSESFFLNRLCCFAVGALLLLQTSCPDAFQPQSQLLPRLIQQCSPQACRGVFLCDILTGYFCFGGYRARSWLGWYGVVWLCGIR